MESDEKTCPFCAEVIKAAAIKCKHCGSVLDPAAARLAPPLQPVPQRPAAPATLQPATPTASIPSAPGAPRPESQAATASARRRRWLLPVLVGGALVVIAVVTLVVLLARGKKEARYEAPEYLGRIGASAEQYYAMMQLRYEEGAAAGTAGLWGEPRFPSTPAVSRPCDGPDCNPECVPRSFESVKGGRSYAAAEQDWFGPSGWREPQGAWGLMQFSREGPIHFQYCYASTAPDEFTIHAFGDLDGDGVPSEFRRLGRVVGGSAIVEPLEAINEGE